MIDTPDVKVVQFLQVPFDECMQQVRPIVLGPRRAERTTALCAAVRGQVGEAAELLVGDEPAPGVPGQVRGW